MTKVKVIVACLLFGISVFAQELVSTETEKTGVVESIYGLEGVFVENQYRYLSVSPPSESVFFQSLETIVPVDWRNFPAEFTKQMYAEMDANGYPLYRVSIYEDPVTRETVFLNMYDRVIYRLPPEKGYDPYAWQKVAFGEESFLALDELTRWIYDPAHIAVELTLIPETFYNDYLVDQEEVVAMPMMVMEVLGDSDSFVAEVVRGGNGVVGLHLEFPDTFGTRQMEILAASDLMDPQSWEVAVNRFPASSGVVMFWPDATASNYPTRFYYVGDVDQDSDGDGYSDFRETHVTNTSPFVFDYVDNDGDGMHDWYEEKIFGSLSETGDGDYDGDRLANNEEMILHANSVEMVCSPIFPDTDGDGVEDFIELFLGSDPNDPGDDGIPPGTTTGYDDGCLDSEGSVDVSLSLSVDSDPEDSSSGYGMYLGSCELEVTPGNSAGETCTLDKGESYVMSISCLQGGQPWWYDASVSGSGILPSSLGFGGAEDVSETIHAPLFSVESVEGTDVSLDGDARYLSRQSGDVTVTLRLEPGDCPVPASFSWGSGSANGLSCTISLSDGEEQTLFATYNGSQVFLADFSCFEDHSNNPPPPPSYEIAVEISGSPVLSVDQSGEYDATVTIDDFLLEDTVCHWSYAGGKLLGGAEDGIGVTVTAASDPSAVAADQTITCIYADASAEKKVTVFKIDMITPNGDPVDSPCVSGDGQNEFTFSSGSIGELTMYLKASVEPSGIAMDIKDQCRFTVDSIGSSIKGWAFADDGTPIAFEDDLKATITFTDLPENNSDFGTKMVAIYYNDIKIAEHSCEVFFPKIAKNHPGEGSGTTPNWFYYWKDGGVCGIDDTVVYDPSIAYGAYVPGMAAVKIGYDSAWKNTGPDMVTHVEGSNSLTITGSGKGIQCVAETIQHERVHMDVYGLFFVGIQQDPSTDPDGDAIPSMEEPNFEGTSTLTNNPDTYALGVVIDPEYTDYGDEELRCRLKELDLTITVAPERDWANPGSQNYSVWGP